MEIMAAANWNSPDNQSDSPLAGGDAVEVNSRGVSRS
jgi:hypothetical protein